jgi:hypothetical protein
MPRVITVATTAFGTVGLGMTRAIPAQAQPRPTVRSRSSHAGNPLIPLPSLSAPHAPGDGPNW